MPPFKCTTGSLSRKASEAGLPETMMVRFRVHWSHIDEFLELYESHFWDIERELADDPDGRTTRVLVGDGADFHTVVLLYHYNSTDRAAFGRAFDEACAGTGTGSSGSSGFFDKQAELMEMVDDMEVLRFATANLTERTPTTTSG